MQLRLVEIALGQPSVHPYVEILSSLTLASFADLPPPPREHVARAVGVVEPALAKVRALYEQMMREPEPCDAETAAILEPLWGELARSLERIADDLASAKEWLSRGP